MAMVRTWWRQRSLVLTSVAGMTAGGCEAPAPPMSVPESLDGPAILITTTDFSTGALSVYDLERGRMYADVSFASPDAIPFSDGSYVYVLNRFMHDYVSVFDPRDGFALVAEHAVTAAGTASANPHGLAFIGDGQALVSLYGASELQLHDFLRAPGQSMTTSVDTSALADDDGIAETEFVVVHDDRAWVLSHPVDRLDGWTPVGGDQLVEVDWMSGTLVDLDPNLPGVQGIELPCTWSREHQPHPTMPGHVLVLCEGIVDVNLEAASWAWHVPPSSFPGEGAADYLQPQDFVVADDGATTILAMYTADFGEVELWAVEAGALPRLLVGGLQSAERSLAIHGDTLYVGDRSIGDAGLRAFSLDGVSLWASRSTGLPPYAVGSWRPSP